MENNQLKWYHGLLALALFAGVLVMENLGLYEIGYENNGLMIMPPMALILVGLIIWWHRSKNKDLCEQ